MSKYQKLGELKKVVVETYYYETNPNQKHRTYQQRRNKIKSNMPRERIITNYDQTKQIDYVRPHNFVSKFHKNVVSEKSFLQGLENQASWETESLGDSFIKAFDRNLNLVTNKDSDMNFLENFK